MSRFQAKTNVVLDAELEQLRDELGLRANQKADLLRELTALASWIIQQTSEGRTVIARGADGVRKLDLPILDKIRSRGQAPTHLELDDKEVTRLAELMDRGFEPPPALLESLRRIASPKREPPTLTWPDSEV